MNLVRRQAARLADYLYAGWRQVCASASRAQPSQFSSGHLAPVLVLPGVYERWQFMLPLIRELHSLGHPVHVVSALGSNRVPVPLGAQIVDAYLVNQDLHEVVIVAHSKGGLIGKHVLGFGEATHRVRQMVAIATPFGGSRYARLMLGRTLRSFRPGDKTLALLAEELESNARIVSVYASFDPHIPEGSELAGAQNVMIEASGHFRILTHRGTRAEVARATAEERLD